MMGPRARKIAAYGLNLATIAAFAIFLAFALYKLTGIERDMRLNASENMLWVVSQAQREALRFDAAVARQASGIGAPEDVQLRFDLLLSRLLLLSDGPQSRVLETLGFAESFTASADAVMALEPLLETLGPQDRSLALHIAGTLAPLNEVLGRTVNAAMVTEWNQQGARLDESRGAIWQIIGSVIGIMVSGGLLSSRLLVTLNKARRAEQSLRREKQFSNLVVRSSGEGILAMDADGYCTVWNGAMERLIPVSSDAAIGSKLSAISGLFAVETVRSAIEASLAGKSGECSDQAFFAGDLDEPRYLDLLCSPLRNGMEVLGAIVFVRDVTERRAAERALVRHRDELEKLVAERTSDLRATQDRLILAMRDLERAVESERGVAEFYRGFASMVSHQFRTPLAIIDSSAQRLVRRGEKITAEEIAQRAARIRTGITRLTRLVESTLDAARLDTGQIEVRARPCDLTELVQMSCERQTEITPDRDITIADTQPDGTMALCDPTLVEHVLVNLLSNAVKYSQAGDPVQVRIGAAGTTLWCAVSDQGVGIPENEAPRLFERFFRASTARGVTGTGLGLNLSRALARLQGGDVTVETKEGAGSTFTLHLQMAAAGVSNDDQIQERREAALV